MVQSLHATRCRHSRPVVELCPTPINASYLSGPAQCAHFQPSTSHQDVAPYWGAWWNTVVPFVWQAWSYCLPACGLGSADEHVNTASRSCGIMQCGTLYLSFSRVYISWLPPHNSSRATAACQFHGCKERLLLKQWTKKPVMHTLGAPESVKLMYNSQNASLCCLNRHPARVPAASSAPTSPPSKRKPTRPTGPLAPRLGAYEGGRQGT